MSKLGYTWYPKDWATSENVFELNLAERGLYRELIDLAMLNDNKTEIKRDVWCRKFAVSLDELNGFLSILEALTLINLCEKYLFISSCEPRLNLVRGGKKGGENKPEQKPTTKPTLKPIPKPTPKQIEKKEKLKVKEIEIKKNINDIPVFDEVLVYAKEKEPTICVKGLKNKYDSWVENDWRDGNDNVIGNWKSKLLNTMPYMPKIPSTNIVLPKRRVS